MKIIRNNLRFLSCLVGVFLFLGAQAKWSVVDEKLQNDTTDNSLKCCFPVKKVILQDGAGTNIEGWQITGVNECTAASLIDFTSVEEDTGYPVISVATHEVSRRCREFRGPDVFDLSTNMFTTVRIGTDGNLLPLFVTNIVISPNITQFPARWAKNTPLKNLEPKSFPYLRSFGKQSFSCCTNFQADASQFINAGVTNIEEEAFYWTPIKGDLILTNLQKIGWYAFSFNNAPKKVVPKLESVKISGTIDAIPPSCFINSFNIKEVDLRACSQLRSIQDSAFMNCSNLVSDISLIVNPAITNISTLAFKNAPVSGRLILPNVQNVGTSSFYAFNVKAKAGLETVELSPALTNLMAASFDYQTKLSSLVLGSKKITTLGSSLFTDCTSLTNIWFKGYCPSLDILNLILAGVSANLKCKIYASTNLVPDAASGALWTSIATPATEAELSALSEEERTRCFGVYQNSKGQRKAYLIHCRSPYDAPTGVYIRIK